MDLINATNMQAGYTLGMKPDGSESLVVVVKGTFSMPESGVDTVLADEQAPLIEADEFSGDPGYSAPIYEVDYAPLKQRCDVILNGSAYAPPGYSAEKVTVRMRIANSIIKEFNVVGNRIWAGGVSGITHSPPQAFEVMPISYDCAFGGTDDAHPDESKHSAFMPNPVGNGFHKQLAKEFIDGSFLPNTEQVGKSILFPNSSYKPMSFGSIGRNWEPRYKLAGTYDKNWLDNVFPFLPSDFNDLYYQCAPSDQQMDFIQGGEPVELINLTPQGKTIFRLPSIHVPVVFFRKKGEKESMQAVADTVVIEPDLNRLMITWRASLPLKKNIFEIPQVLVGKKSKAWWRARELGKTYYSSLEELRQSKLEEAVEEEA